MSDTENPESNVGEPPPTTPSEQVQPKTKPTPSKQGAARPTRSAAAEPTTARNLSRTAIGRTAPEDPYQSGRRVWPD